MGRPRVVEKTGENIGWKADDLAAAKNRRYILYIDLLEGNACQIMILLFVSLTDVEDSIDVDVDLAEKDVAVTAGDVEEEKEDETDNENIEKQIDSEIDEHGNDASFGQEQEGEEAKDASSDEEERYSGQEEPHNQRQDSSDIEVKTSVDKEEVPSSTQDRER